MRITEKKLAEQIVITEILCNRCGKNIAKNEYGYFAERFSADKSWGYSSDFDGETHSFDLCESCYKELVSGFVIPPDIGS